MEQILELIWLELRRLKGPSGNWGSPKVAQSTRNHRQQYRVSRPYLPFDEEP